MPTRYPTLSALMPMLALAAATLLPGCGESAPTAAADPERARQVLRETLDAWKNGDPHDAPARGSAGVHVADEDWLAGVRLVSYRINPGDEPLGGRLRCPVVLTLRGNRGKARTKTVHYDVATHPAPSVVRLD